MLNKETKEITKNMLLELAPMFATIHKLGEKLSKQASQTRHADSVARAWQYPDTTGWAKDCGEDSETIQRTRKETPHEWHEILNKKYEILHECETLEKVARLNYRNYAAYLCEYIAHLLHQSDTWASFYEKKGIETLAEELKTLTGKHESISIYRDGSGWEPFGNDNFYCYFKITFWGVCGVRASDWATYTETKKGSLKQWKEPTEPKRYTLAQYLKIVKELKELENEAKATARKHHDKARETGLIYFIGGLSDPQLNVWGKND